MPRRETIVSVFIASPSDLDEERNRLEEVIRELNIAWARDLGIRLELIRWETHAFPGFGDDGQAVINDQIPDDYDIFIGIMWYRFGTPTKRAESGTHEEFQRAKARFDRDPSSLQLMIYFKDAQIPLPPSKIDFTQLEKVTTFRNSLGSEGGLYWPFASVEDFEKLTRLHLTRCVQAWRSKSEVGQNNRSSDAANSYSNGDSQTTLPEVEDEPGLLDLMEQFEDEFDALSDISERILSATTDIGTQINIRAAELKAFTKGPEASDRKAAKRLIAKAADDMDQFARRMEAELPLFSQRLESGMNALVRAAQMTSEFSVGDKDLEQVEQNLESVRQFRSTIVSVEGQITAFQQTVAELPRMTTTLNRAKRAVVNILQRLIDEFQLCHTMSREAEASFESLIAKQIDNQE